MQSGAVLDPRLLEVAADVAAALVRRDETVAVAEGSCGGLLSASLLALPGASRYYRGGAVIYTPSATKAFIAPWLPPPPGLRGATEELAAYLARGVAAALGATWGIGEGGATGPGSNPYGDPPGHAWVAVAAAGSDAATRHLLTGADDRQANMVAFAVAALELLLAQLDRP